MGFNPVGILYTMKAISVLVTSASLFLTGCVHNTQWTAGSHRQLRADEHAGGSHLQQRGDEEYRTQGQTVDDNKLVADVKAALKASAVYKFPYVQVQAYNGVAQLSGFVMKETERQEAVELTLRVPGLREVINNISLMMPANRELATGRPTYGPYR